jgi:hypothetical protein
LQSALTTARPERSRGIFMWREFHHAQGGGGCERQVFRADQSSSRALLHVRCTNSSQALPSVTMRSAFVTVQRCESSVRSLATRCIHPQRQQNAALAGDLDDVPLGTPKRHLLFSRRASTKSTTSRPKQMIPTTDIQKTNSRISVSCLLSVVTRDNSPRRLCFPPTARAPASTDKESIT